MAERCQLQEVIEGTLHQHLSIRETADKHAWKDVSSGVFVEAKWHGTPEGSLALVRPALGQS